MPIIMATAIYPSHQQAEFLKIFIKVQGKYDVDDLIENHISCINATTSGIKIINIYQVKPGNFDEVFMIIGQQHYQFINIEGFEYSICGEGPYKSHLANLIDRLNIGYKVKLRGYVEPEQLQREYESAAVFILPSVAENFPVVLLEAMASGCAVITSDSTGCAEVVGDTALPVRPEDAEDIKQRLLTLINDPDLCRELGRKGRERVESMFTWNIIARRYAALYEEVAGIENRSGNRRGSGQSL